MKTKILLNILILTSFIGCKKEEHLIINEVSVTFNIENEYLQDDQDADILIHNMNGLLIDCIKDVKNRTTDHLLFQNNGESFFFTLVTHSESTTDYYKINTFLIDEPTKIKLGTYINRNIRKDIFSINKNGATTRNTVTNSISRQGNNESIELTPEFFPHNEILSFQENGEGARKVLTLNDVEPNEIYVLNPDELNNVIDSIEFEIVDFGTFYSTLHGKRENIDSNYMLISQVLDH